MAFGIHRGGEMSKGYSALPKECFIKIMAYIRIYFSIYEY